MKHLEYPKTMTEEDIKADKSVAEVADHLSHELIQAGFEMDPPTYELRGIEYLYNTGARSFKKDGVELRVHHLWNGSGGEPKNWPAITLKITFEHDDYAKQTRLAEEIARCVEEYL